MRTPHPEVCEHSNPEHAWLPSSLFIKKLACGLPGLTSMRLGTARDGRLTSSLWMREKSSFVASPTGPSDGASCARVAPSLPWHDVESEQERCKIGRTSAASVTGTARAWYFV